MVARQRKGQNARVVAPSGGTATKCAVDVPAVLGAVESLYHDQIKPSSQILCKRISERSLLSTLSPAGRSGAQREINIRDLRALCSECEQLVVESGEAGDWVAFLVGRQRAFVDADAKWDPYPDVFWSELASQCVGDWRDSLRLPGGRFACAVALQASNLSCLFGRSLGEIAHIVQLALSERKIWRYSSGAIVPYSLSQSTWKEHGAKSHRPCSVSGMPKLAVGWEVARGCLQQILQASPAGRLPVANVKRLFQSRFHLDLSETAFGYSDVSELLQDPSFEGICDVQLCVHGYLVVQTRQQLHVDVAQQKCSPRPHAITLERGSSAPACITNELVLAQGPHRVELGEAVRLSCEDVLPRRDVPVFLVQTPSSSCATPTATWCLTPSTCLALSQDGYRSIVQNTFIQLKREPATPRLARSRSVPASFSYASSNENRNEPSQQFSDSASDACSTDGECSSSLEDEQLIPLREVLNSLPRGGPEPAGLGTPVDSITGSVRTPLSALRTPVSRRIPHRVCFGLDDLLGKLEISPLELALGTPAQPMQENNVAMRVTRACMEEVSNALEIQAAKPASGGEQHRALKPTLSGFQSREGEVVPSLLTPGGLSKRGFVISNTFIEEKQPPLTPFSRRREARRSRSVGT